MMGNMILQVSRILHGTVSPGERPIALRQLRRVQLHYVKCSIAMTVQIVPILTSKVLPVKCCHVFQCREGRDLPEMNIS